MFIRKNKNRSGSVSIQVISKEKSKYRVIKTLGSSNDPEEIQRMCLDAKIFVSQKQNANQLSLFLEEDELAIENFVKNLRNKDIRVIGPELILGKLPSSYLKFKKPLINKDFQFLLGTTFF